MSRPGFMVYFDWQHILRALSDDQRGKLVLAMVDYAEREQMPHFDDPVTAMAWNALWPRLDEDSRRYAETVKHQQEMGYNVLGYVSEDQAQWDDAEWLDDEDFDFDEADETIAETIADIAEVSKKDDELIEEAAEAAEESDGQL